MDTSSFELIALRHNLSGASGAITLRMLPTAQGQDLLAKASSGDTLHKVPATRDVKLLMNLVQAQLESGDYVLVP